MPPVSAHPSRRRASALAVCALACLLIGGAARAADPGCHYVQGSTLKLKLLGRLHVPLVDATINDQPVQMLVDTGSQRTYVSRTLAEKLDIPLHPTDQLVLGIGGLAVTQMGRLREMTVGDSHVKNGYLPVLDDSERHFSSGGILGADFLLNQDVELALREKRITFFHPQGCNDTFLAYWDKDAAEVLLEPFSPANRGAHFEVALNGVKVRAMIDTGAEVSTLTWDAAKRVGVTPDSTGVVRNGEQQGIGAATIASWSAPFDSFAIGSETIKNVRISVIGQEGARGHDDMPEMLLGTDFLNAHRVLIAMGQQHLYLSYLGGKVFAASDAKQAAQ